MTCFLCEERPANKSGMCQPCFNSHWNKEFWQKRRAEHEARQAQIAAETVADRRAFLSMMKGAQNALRRLQKRYPDCDMTGALSQCRERIEFLENSVR